MTSPIRGPYPVVGDLEPYRVPSWFQRFDTGTVHGLALVRGRRLDVLAVATWQPGQGHFTRFLDDCMAHYDAVGFWELLNPDLEAYLAQRGFHPAVQCFDRDGCDGVEWNRP